VFPERGNIKQISGSAICEANTDKTAKLGGKRGVEIGGKKIQGVCASQMATQDRHPE